MYRTFVKNYVSHSEQIKLNKDAPNGKRWCNFLCQEYIDNDKFYQNPARVSGLCMKCESYYKIVKRYVKQGKLTIEDFKENPSIAEEIRNPTRINDNIVVECTRCKAEKPKKCFDINRKVCRECRLKEKKERTKKDIEENIANVEKLKDNTPSLEIYITSLPIDKILVLLRHYNIGRYDTDKKTDHIAKIIRHFNQLQHPLKCLGNCGFTLSTQFSYCEQCKQNPTQRTHEANLKFKENLPTFITNLEKITEDDQFNYNIYCIKELANYLGIKVSNSNGYTKKFYIDQINEKLEERNKKNEKALIKAPEPLELNGIMVLAREDGFINATALCKAGGKRFGNWNQLESTKELIQVLESETGITKQTLIDVNKGNSCKFAQGSWIHPKLTIHLAQWISSKFAIQVSYWIDEWKNLSCENEQRYIKSLENIEPDEDQSHLEKDIQLKLQNTLGGEIEVPTKFGYIDLLTDTELIEIKEGKNWKHGIGQLFAYSKFYPNHNMRLHLFNTEEDQEITDWCNQMNIFVSYE